MDKTKTIGIITTEFDGAMLLMRPYSQTISAGIVARAAEEDFDVLLYSHAWKTSETSNALVLENPLDGLVAIAPRIGSDCIAAIVAAGVPCVGVSAPGPDGIANVDVDNLLGASLIVEHLIGLGHRRIAHLTGSMTQRTAILRRAAFEEVMRAHGLAIVDSFVVETGYYTPDAYARAIRLLRGPDRPTAVFAGNDSIAVGTIQAARELSIPVPQRLSVVGFDDLPVAAGHDPPLTTLRQPLEEMGRLAANLLIEEISGKKPDRRDYLLPGELILRGTTMAASTS
ncbi:MAG: LacI family DNA-binding transcriptional regulator [Capsulimonadaceae bacterium]